MRYESLITVDEKNKWLELEVTLGTNEVLINQDLSKLQRFLKTFDELEKAAIETTSGLTLNLNTTLSLDHNSQLLKLLLVKKFITNMVCQLLEKPDQALDYLKKLFS